MVVNALVIWATQVLQLVPQLIMVPFLLRTIGDAGYGEYALIWSLLLAVEQLEVSLQSGIVKYTAACLATDRLDEVNRILSSTFVFSLAIGLLAGIVMCSLPFFDSSMSRGMALSLVMVGVMMVFLTPTTPYQGMILARQRHYVKALAGIVAQYGAMGLTMAWFLWKGPSVGAVVAISVGTLLLSRIAQIPIAHRLIRGLHNSMRSFDFRIFRLVASFGALIVLSALCMVFNSTGMRWLGGVLASTTFVAHLAIFLMPGLLLARIIQAMTITVMPAASAYQATDNQKMLRELFVKATRYIVLLVVLCLLVAALLVRDVLNLWVGPQYQFLQTHVMINLVGVAILVSASCAHNMLKGFGELRKVLVAFLLGLVVIPFGVFLVVFLWFGTAYFAASLGLLLGNATAGILQCRYCLKATGQKWRPFVVESVLQPVASAAFGFAAAFIVLLVASPKNLMVKAMIAAMAVLLTLGAFITLFTSQDERLRFRSLVRSMKERAAGFSSALSMKGRSPRA